MYVERFVEQIWYFAKETQFQALKCKGFRVMTTYKTRHFMPTFRIAYELKLLKRGSSQILRCHIPILQAISEESMTQRKPFEKFLKEEGRNSSSGIASQIARDSIEGDTFIGSKEQTKEKFRFWNAGNLPREAIMKTGSFSPAPRGSKSIYLSFGNQILKHGSRSKRKQDQKQIGIYLGLQVPNRTSGYQKGDRSNLRAKQLANLKKLEKPRRRGLLLSHKREFGVMPKDSPGKIKNLQAKVNHAKDDHQRQSIEFTRWSNLISACGLHFLLMNQSKMAVRNLT